MNWLTDFVKPKLSSLVNRKDPPSDLWTKCGCGERMLYVSDLKENLHICSYCDQHMYIDFDSRFKQLFDDQQYDLIDIPFENNDPFEQEWQWTVRPDCRKLTSRCRLANHGIIGGLIHQ